MKDMSTKQSGYAASIENLEKVINFCTSYGTKYNPINPNIQLTALNALLIASREAINFVHICHGEYTHTINERKIALKNAEELVMRCVNSLQGAGLSKETIENVKSLSRKFRGVRLKSATTKTREENEEINAGENKTAAKEEAPKKTAAAQTTFNNKLEHITRLINIQANEQSYRPNETELTTENLTAVLATLNQLNTAVIDAYTNLSNARIERNRLFFEENTGLVNIMPEVKNYVKGVYKANSEQFRQISKLQFKNFTK